MPELVNTYEAQLLLAAADLLQRIEGRATRASYDSSSVFNLGRCAEACDQARDELHNALITLKVYGDQDAAAVALAPPVEA